MRVALLALLLIPSAVLAQTRNFTLFLGDRPGGHATLRVQGNVRDVDFEMSDRSVVTKLLEHIVVDDDGTARELRITGQAGGPQPVDEKFVRRDQRGMYVSQSGVPEEYAILARALLRAHGPVPLLPSGTATLERGEPITVTAGKVSQRITPYEIGGIDLEPLTIWLDDKMELFAAGDMLMTGWEAAVPAVLEAQRQRAAARQQQLASKLMRRPGRSLVFEHARLFDPETRRLIPNTTVVVAADHVRLVGRDGTVAIPTDAERIDAHNRVMLPGLWDLHAHIGSRVQGILLIAAGVTTVRIMGGAKDEFVDGQAIGPRQLLVGVLDGHSPNASATPLLVDDEAGVRKAIDQIAAKGFVQAKVYNSFKAALVPAFVDEAHKRGLRTSGHVPDGMKALDLVHEGIDELQHAYMVLLQFVREPPLKDLTPLSRFKAFAEQAGAIDFNSPAVRDFVKQLKARNVDVDLTLVSGEQQLTARPGEPSPVYAAIAKRLPAQTERQFEVGGLAPSPSAFAATLKLARVLYDAGVPLAFGTDELMYGFSADRELELYVKAGVSPGDALYAATLGAARIMKRDKDLGSIAPGKIADLVLVDGDPLANISAVRRPTLVCKNGNLYDPIALWRAVGIAPYSPAPAQ
ncbi:MAG: amidohydrolase [bacterium]|nr:amidohydrolase [bacterium]